MGKLTGIGASKGRAEGIARIVEGVSDIARFTEGDILVAKMTEPSMVIMMNKSAAIVTDVGGYTCHAAIVARELGIPCVVATRTATSTIKEGSHVVVDGDAQEVSYR